MLFFRPCVRLGLLPTLLGLGCVLASSAAAEPPAEGQATPNAAPLVKLDLHGEMRTRLDYLSGVRFTTSDPSIAPHLDVRHGEQNTTPQDGRMGIGDLRLRFEPVLHVAEWADICTQIDGVSNLVLGGQSRAGNDTEAPTIAPLKTSPDNYSASAANNQANYLAQWSSPTGGVASTAAIGVRRAWVHVRVLGMGEVDIGRMGDHFGLGMVRNDGRDLFSDFQTDLDRLQVSAEFFGLRLKIARDILFNGPLSSTAATGNSVLTRGVNATVIDGQPMALQDSADATRWLLQAESAKPVDAPGLKFAAALMYQSMDNGFYGEHGDCSAQKTCDQLIPRSVRQFTPQLYLDWRGKLADSPLRLQLEGAFRYGTVTNADERTSTVTSNTLVGGGFASKGQWQVGRSAWNLDLGMASGARGGGFGVNDQSNWRTGAAPDAAPNSLITGFNFHRGFLVDSILFRDIIGAVANAWYFKPNWQYNLLETGADRGLSVQAGVLTALAASDNATPGKSTFLGVEPEASIWWKTSLATAVLRGSYLLPGAALDAPSGARALSVWRVDAALRLKF
jgi:uncharacterized protein (TIGR04551 family)